MRSIYVVLLLVSFVFSAIPCSTAEVAKRRKVVITAISAGYSHSLALSRAGVVYSWGDNNFSQLGNVDSKRSCVPHRVPKLSRVKKISAGMFFSMVLKEDGSVWCWGSNKCGQLGTSTFEDSKEPVLAIFPKGTILVDIEAGGSQAFAIDSFGKVWAWGDNSLGQLGNGNTKNKNTPAKVKKVRNICHVSSCGLHVAAMEKDGTIWTWGSNKNIQLGAVGDDVRKIPKKVHLGMRPMITVEAGDTTVLLRQDFLVWVMGWNSLSLTGNGSDARKKFYKGEPQQKMRLKLISNISSYGHTLALSKSGQVWAWGSNRVGQLGNGSRDDSNEAIKIENLEGIVQISAGCRYSLALSKDGTVWGWGENTRGQLGDASVLDRLTPVQPIDWK